MTFYEAYTKQYKIISGLLSREALEALSKHNHGWHPDNFDQFNYLRLSFTRYTFVMNYIQKYYPRKDLYICDVGGFFGVFPAALKAMGYKVAMTEKFAYYAGHFEGIMKYLQDQGIKIFDADLVLEEADLSEKFDLITCMAVIEHLPNSPRLLFENFKKHLAPGGGLVIEVPNIAKLHKRLRFLAGRSVLPPIQHIYKSDVPFIGHHHEYTIDELKWLLNESGFKIKRLDTHNYSKSPLRQKIMKLFPKSMHEVIISFSEVEDDQ